MTAEQLREYLQGLHQRRVKAPARIAARARRRRSLSGPQRRAVLATTGGRCHICGGAIGPEQKWQADHVLAHSSGGAHAIDNYLPAHALCNNYRWDYLPEEFQLILKLGVYARTLIQRGDPTAMQLARKFTAHELRRQARRRPGRSSTD